jgi:hypothetical protein
VDAVLAEPESALDPEPEPDVAAPLLLVLLLLVLPLVPEPLAEVLAVVLEDEVPEPDEVLVTHGATGVDVLCVGGLELVLPDGGGLALPAVEVETRTLEQVEAPVAVDPDPPLASAPVEVDPSVVEGSLSPEAPVDGVKPAPPAVTLWWSLGLASRVTGGATVAASLGALETVAFTAPTMAWMAAGWAGAGDRDGAWWRLTTAPGWA